MIKSLINHIIIVTISTLLSIIVIVTGLIKLLFNAPTYLGHIFVANYKDIRNQVLNK